MLLFQEIYLMMLLLQKTYLCIGAFIFNLSKPRLPKVYTKGYASNIGKVYFAMAMHLPILPISPSITSLALCQSSPSGISETLKIRVMEQLNLGEN